LLARLALDAGRAVTVATLVDDVWGDAPPAAAGNALPALVSRLRRAIGPELVGTGAGGYRLRVDTDDVDALRFEGLLGAAVTASAHTHALLGQALALWRGPALADIRDLPFAGPVADRLAERRAGAVEQRARIALHQGLIARDGLAVELDELATLLDAQPLRESTAALLAQALHTAGRQTDALAVVDRTRARLADELGVDPGPQLASAR
jgi:DNA-binding SARP family transcriptional activator